MSYCNTSENTFFNTSLDILSHYGVAGMKWGVWNDETQRKYRGGVRGIDSKLSNKNLDVKISDYTDAAKSMKADLKAANLGGKFVSYFKKDRYASTGYCTAAYLLRKSGYDVAAKTSKITATPQDIQNLYKNPKVDIKIKDSSPESIAVLKNKLASQGEGASGFLIGSYKNSEKNGRVLAYTIANGKVNIVDGQSGKIHSSDMSINNTLKHYGGIQAVRTDNKAVNEKYAQKVAGSKELLKVTDNKLDKTKIALTSAGAIATAMTTGTLLINQGLINEQKTLISQTAMGKLSELADKHLPNSDNIKEFSDNLNDLYGAVTGKKGTLNSSQAQTEANKLRKSLTDEATREAIKELQSNNYEYQSRQIMINDLSKKAITTALGGAAAALGVKVTSIVRHTTPTSAIKDSNKTSDKAYEKAARNYLKEHPNSNMSIAELAAKYKKEWTEGNK